MATIDRQELDRLERRSLQLTILSAVFVIVLASGLAMFMYPLDFGKPDVRSKQTGSWAADLKALAARPNVVCKISGLTTEADWKHWQPSDLKFYFGWALECFGFDRVLFGGDWPVATLATSYERWVQTIQDFLSFARDVDQIKLFRTNAERIYRV